MQYHDADTLLDGFENNTKRFVKILCEAADDAMPIPDRQDIEEDIYDILYNQVRILPDKLSAAFEQTSSNWLLSTHAVDAQRRARLEALQAEGIEVTCCLNFFCSEYAHALP